MALARSASGREPPDTDSLNFMIDHVFLPPRLPQEDDTTKEHLFAMVQALRDSASEFVSVGCSSVQPALEMLDRFLKTCPGAGLGETDQTTLLRNMISGLRNGDVALFHLRRQNAGLLLTTRQDHILFEAFELLAPNQDVMSCKGSLLREFPDRAALVPIEKVRDANFSDELVDIIEKLDLCVAPMARPKTGKAGTVQPEERDTLSPVLVTGMLIDVLAGLGKGVEPGRVTKRSKEHAGWDDARLPFHRSSTWLLLRVALRLVLDRLAAESWYKPLMVYHHARILSMAAGATQPQIASDKLFSMKAKVGRRIIKLNLAEETPWLRDVRKMVLESEAVLNKRWEEVQLGDTKILPLNELSGLSFYQDSELKLQNLRQHLSWIKSRSASNRDPMGPGDTTRFDPLSDLELPALSSSMPEDAILDRSQLLDFEAWAELALPTWLDGQLQLVVTHPVFADTTLSNLSALIDAYYKRACAAYEGIPDALSIMYLVVMELWVAMDRIAGKVIPLLLDYDPGFPMDIFHPLLLERKEEMGRLKGVEDYLSRRKNGARSPYPSAFEGFGRKDSFAVRFYRTSPEHQRLREKIENWGAKKKAEKLREYEEMTAKYDSLDARRNGMPCDDYWDSRWEEPSHSPSCTRCRLKREMDALTIHVFEWPLPENSNHAKAAVVDIQCPHVAKIWRNTTWHLSTDVFREGSERLCASSSEKLYFAGGFGGLQQFLQNTSRLRPASTIKPMEVTHYNKGKHITEATPSTVCVPHAAKYSYYDEPLRLPAEEGIPGVCVPSHCSYAEVAKGLGVESWIRYATHTSNDVVAGQFRCPADTTLEEFRAFGNLRSGVTLQWANVLCQLVIPSVDLNKKATFALILQTCLEAGPGSEPLGGDSSIWRKAHIDTQNESFMNRILQALDGALERVRESWQNDIAVCLLACLATRLLSLSPSTDISNTLLEYLAQLRKVSIDWARLLLDKLNGSADDRERQEWTRRLVMAALICAATFNIGEECLASVLSDPRDLAFFAESAVLVRNHLPASGRPSDPIALQLMHRCHAVMYRARNAVTGEVVNKGNAGLNIAIKQFWADYSPPSANWVSRNSETQDHIVECSNADLSINFNLLTGNLFINGYPLSKLPLAYQQHQTFKELFGDQILDVGPSSVPGMQFSACRDQNGWVVHFAMKDRQLVVRTIRQRPQSNDEVDDESQKAWEYIPRGHLEEDLPNSFVYNYTHWLNLSTNEVEFRPIDDKWVTYPPTWRFTRVSSPRTWRLTRVPSPRTWRLTRVSGRDVLKKGSSFVVDPESRTAELVHEILASIESFGNINPIFDHVDNCLVLELPRHSISFSIRQGETAVKSKNYAGMQIDVKQGFGSLIGLSNKLVLKPNDGPGFRVLLVPRGQISAHYARAVDHVKVDISTGSASHVRHASFIIDSKLGCLTDTGSLQSKLYLCLLHALTSHSLPDPLTLRTGTEEALRILGGAAVRSYPTLDPDSCYLLGQIANISPRRAYYPSHLRVMEQTKWNYDIPSLSQHDGFWPLAKSIYDGYETFGELFQLGDGKGGTMPSSKIFKGSETQRSSNLEERARIRNSTFRSSEFGAEEYAVKDEWYRPSSRATTGSAKNRAKVAQLARAVDSGCGHLLFSPSLNLPQLIVSINGRKFEGYPKVDLAFHLGCLDNPSTALEGLWCGLHRALVTETNKYKKIFFLSSLLYAEGSCKNIAQALMALGSISVFSQDEMLPPPEREFNLTIDRNTLSDVLTKTVKSGAKGLERCPEYSLTRLPNESIRSLEGRRKQAWAFKSKGKIREFVAALLAQIGPAWTVDAPIDDAYGLYLDVDVIMSQVRSQVEMARRSEAFKVYLTSMSKTLALADIMTNNPTVLPNGGTVRPSRASKNGFISAMAIFSQLAPRLDHPRPELFPELCADRPEPGKKHERLATLVDELSGVDGLQSNQASYINELRASMDSAGVHQRLISVSKDDPTIQPALAQNLQRALKEYNAISQEIELALRTGTSIAHQICDKAGLYPRTSPVFFLQRLTRTFWTRLSKEWRQCLVKLALSLIYLQRAERLASHGDNLLERWSDLQRELANPGDHGNQDWNPLEYPESLLLEIEQGIMIRPIQNSIAAVMRSPPNMKNSVMQLNMGEGKSSVIVPVEVTALADGNRLVRVVVAKPQSSQMMHMLISKLGGLINRRVFYLPFSRSIQLSEGGVQKVRRIIETCQSEGGVLLVQPEHLLSFKLMGIDKSWTGEKDTTSVLGKKIIRLHQDFESISRDIVDESDENFSVKFELVYTMGSQQPVEMSPDRWILTQELLKVAERVARRMMATEEAMSGMSEVLLFKDYGGGRVPVIRVLGESAGRQLIRELATEVCRFGLAGFQVHHQTDSMKQAVLNYILLEQGGEDDIAMVENSSLFSNPPTKSALLLLRGLLAKGVILFALGQKRFRVNYGLALDRQPPTMLAVPYRAKDIPSPRSEFSHPDVVIVLTCLSYYYRGLSNAELYTCLELLNKSDSAEQEYGRWSAESPSLPSSFRTFSSINLKDRPQCEGVVFPKLRHARPAVDFYLSRVVFPREMKQFPFKLSASGWDLAKPKTHPLTGFSGTNDSKNVLPLCVEALDRQPHTNAAVLSTLLQEENTVLELGVAGESQLSALTEEMLIGALGQSEPPMRVILDVGAQIIESSNLQMAEKFLDSVSATDIDAVIFFNDHDELSVLTRNGAVDWFLTSPFATHTNRCVVYLDQSHTRGTDLKLPDNYRAAVTLGPGVTKDTLVQACMRMRKLGQGQSVSFIVSPEMQKRIRSVRNITDQRPLGVSDVLAWAISETWDETTRSVPLWATQGVRHLRQERVWQQANEAGDFSSANVDEYLEDEAMTLEQRYRPKPTTTGDTEITTLMASLDLNTQPSAHEASQRAAIKDKLAEFTNRTTTSSSLQEEQERELAPEIEQERQIFRPLPRNALTHKLHHHLLQFVHTGAIPPNSPAFLRPFTALSKTSAAALFPSSLASFPGDLLITSDFARTVDETGPEYCSDSYQRGVQWVLLTHPITEEGCKAGKVKMVVVSQWEADQLKAQLQQQQQGSGPVVTLHAYLPRPSLTFQSMEDLATYTVPPLPAGWAAPPELVMQLNLFAGQLYLRSYEEYVRLCRYLGLAYSENKGDEVVAPDGFVGRKGYPECEFEESPVAFLAEVYKKIRRDCVGIERTHMGRVLAGEILMERDF